VDSTHAQRRRSGGPRSPVRSPVIHVVHAARADDGTALEVSESVWPAERVVVVDDYPIEQDADESAAPSEV